MSDVSQSARGAPSRAPVPVSAAPGPAHGTAEAGSGAGPGNGHRVGRGFIALYAAAYMSAIVVLIAPLLVTLALKVNALVGADQAPASLSLVAGTGALLAMVGNPLFGQLSDRTTSRFGMRRPWLVIGLFGGSAGTFIVARAPNIAVVVVGWCLAQLFFNALLAALIAVLPDRVPTTQRGVVSGVLGICLPVASVCGTYLVKVFSGSLLAMFMAPCVLGGAVILLFAARLDDRRLSRADKAPWSVLEFARTFYVAPRANPDFAWAFASRFLFVLAYAFLTTYEVYFLLDRIGTTKGNVPGQVFMATLVQSVLIVAASLVAGRLSDRTGAARCSSSPRPLCSPQRCSSSPPSAATTASSSPWPSAALASAPTSPSTSPSSSTCSQTESIRPRISGWPTSPARSRTPSPPPSHPPSWRPEATAPCTRSPASAPSSGPPPSWP